MDPFLLSIDPGISTGWAVFSKKSVLLACGAGPDACFRKVPVSRAVIEMPRVYRAAKSKGDPNDLITLAVRVGRYTEQLEAQGIDVSYLHPATWKGQLTKAVHHPRILARIKTDAEKLLVVEASKKVTAKVLEDMIDAVGLGLYFLASV